MESVVQAARINEMVRAGMNPSVRPLEFNPFDTMRQIRRRARRVRLRSRGYDFEWINGYSTEAINRKFKIIADAARLNWAPEFFQVTGVRTGATIITAVCGRYGVTRDDIVSPSRANGIVRPRQICMFIMRRCTKLSLPQIGRIFGKCDHTAVLYAVRKVEKLIERDSFIAGEVQILLDALKPPVVPA